MEQNTEQGDPLAPALMPTHGTEGSDVARYKSPFPCLKCGWDNGKTKRSLQMHDVRTHGNKRWDTSGNFRKRKARIARPPVKKKYRYPSDNPKYRKAHYGKALKNGATAPAPEPKQRDYLRDAAHAIMAAAQVIRSVSVGLKL